MTELFTNGIYSFVYDFESLTIQQVITAEGLVSFRNHAMRKPARSLRDYELGGHVLFNQKLMAVLLRKYNADGSLEAWDDRQSRKDAEAFLANLPAGDYTRLMECKADFFGRANIADYESIMQLAPLVEGLGGLSQQQQPSEQSRSSATAESENSTSDSTLVESSSAD